MKTHKKILIKSIALAVAFVAFCACSGKNIEIAKRIRAKQLWDAQLLNFDDAKKEVGLTNECYKDKAANSHYRFIKRADGAVDVIIVNESKNGDSFSMVEAKEGGKKLTLEQFKAKKPECFK